MGMLIWALRFSWLLELASSGHWGNCISFFSTFSSFTNTKGCHLWPLLHTCVKLVVMRPFTFEEDMGSITQLFPIIKQLKSSMLMDLNGSKWIFSLQYILSICLVHPKFQHDILNLTFFSLLPAICASIPTSAHHMTLSPGRAERGLSRGSFTTP